MTNTVFCGLPGEGKTIRMVRGLKMGYESDYTLVTNLKLTKLPYVKFDIQTIYDAMLADKDLNEIYHSKKICLGIDELPTVADSRKFSSEANIILSYLFMQSRKRGIEMFGTAQFFTDFDLRVRKLCDWKVGCRKLGTYDNPIKFIYKYKHRFKPQSSYISSWPFEQAKEMFEHYDTFQVINPQFLKSKKN